MEGGWESLSPGSLLPQRLHLGPASQDYVPWSIFDVLCRPGSYWHVSKEVLSHLKGTTGSSAEDHWGERCPPVLVRTCKLKHPKGPKSDGIQTLEGFHKINLEFINFAIFFLSHHSDLVKWSSYECNHTLPVLFSWKGDTTLSCLRRQWGDKLKTMRCSQLSSADIRPGKGEQRHPKPVWRSYPGACLQLGPAQEFSVEEPRKHGIAFL